MTEETYPGAVSYGAEAYGQQETLDPRIAAAIGIMSVQAFMIRNGAVEAAQTLGEQFITALQSEMDMDAIRDEEDRIAFYADLEDRARRDDDNVTSLDSNKKKSPALSSELVAA